MAAKDTDLWRITYEGEKYTLARTDITVGVLRQMKSWFGPAYGKYLSFVQLLIEGDADAWACAIWIVLRASGRNIRTPQNLDFAVSEVMAADDDDDELDPEPVLPEAGPTPDSSGSDATPA
ncbi:MAG: hypothetical protein JO130_18590 [Solirubrobacterales bacterium]|nr:hypothetical protein [Solirubrobacterales bacterium]